MANSTITGEGDCLVRASCAPDADGSESISMLNNVFQGQDQYLYPGEKSCLALTEGCPVDPLYIDYSLIGDVRNDSCPGANDLCADVLGLADSRIRRFDAHLTSKSPALNSGLPAGGLIPADDFDGTPRPLWSGVDRGAYESWIVPTRQEQLCRKEIRTRLVNYFGATLKAMQQCINRVNMGLATAPCPDSEASAAIARAESKIDPERMERKCPAEVVAEMVLGGACSGASASELASCLIAEASEATNVLLNIEYAAPAELLTNPEEQKCQALIARRLGDPYAVKRVKLLNRCLDKRDRGDVTSCPDPLSELRIARSRGRAETRIANQCSDELVVQLQGSGGFDGCEEATTLSELITCELAEHDTHTDRLVNIVP